MGLRQTEWHCIDTTRVDIAAKVGTLGSGCLVGASRATRGAVAQSKCPVVRARTPKAIVHQISGIMAATSKAPLPIIE